MCDKKRKFVQRLRKSELQIAACLQMASVFQKPFKSLASKLVIVLTF